MSNSKSFNKIIFMALLANATLESNNGLEQIMTMLNQRSDDSRKARVNHNCVFNGIPFTWDYNGDKKVFTIPMHKISTGWDFFIDIEESGDIYLSEGKYTNRTKVNPNILMDLRPSIRGRILSMLTILTAEHPNGEPNESVSYYFDRFEFYKLAYMEPDFVYGMYKSGTYYECQRIGNAEKIVDHSFINPENDVQNPVIYYIGKPQRDSENKYYRNCTILKPNVSIMDIDWLRNHKPDFKLMFKDYKLHPVCDSDTWYSEISEIHTFVGLSGKELTDLFSGIDDSNQDYFYIGMERLAVTMWSQIPELRRPRIFVYHKSGTYFDDITEIDLTEESEDNEIITEDDMNRALYGRIRFAHCIDEDNEIITDED